VLGLKDVFLDYAGGFPQDHAVHTHLSRLVAGDKVFLTAAKAAIEIRDREGFGIGRLSNSSAIKWSARVDRIREVRVLAMIERDRLDPQEAFRGLIKAEKWEVPVLEVVWG
jgi:ATP-dependent DNA helicase RecQ